MSEATNETSEPSTGLGLFAGSSTDFVTRIKQKKPIAVRFRGIQVTDTLSLPWLETEATLLNRHKRQTRGIA